MTEPDTPRPAWWSAAVFMALIDNIVYPFVPAQPQLTTGPTCICPHGVPDVWCANNHHARQAMDRELGLLRPPPLPPVPPCACTYRIWTTRIVIPPRERTRARPRAYQVVSGTGFTINPDCEHHGDLRRTEYFDATYLEVLDEDERRGH